MGYLGSNCSMARSFYPPFNTPTHRSHKFVCISSGCQFLLELKFCTGRYSLAKSVNSIRHSPALSAGEAVVSFPGGSFTCYVSVRHCCNGWPSNQCSLWPALLVAGIMAADGFLAGETSAA